VKFGRAEDQLRPPPFLHCFDDPEAEDGFTVEDEPFGAPTVSEPWDHPPSDFTLSEEFFGLNHPV